MFLTHIPHMISSSLSPNNTLPYLSLSVFYPLTISFSSLLFLFQVQTILASVNVYNLTAQRAKLLSALMRAPSELILAIPKVIIILCVKLCYIVLYCVIRHCVYFIVYIFFYCVIIISINESCVRVNISYS